MLSTSFSMKLIHIHFIPDKRKGMCYRERRCSMEIGDMTTKANCCCSAFSQAWSHNNLCEVCPLKNSGILLLHFYFL